MDKNEFMKQAECATWHFSVKKALAFAVSVACAFGAWAGETVSLEPLSAQGRMDAGE